VLCLCLSFCLASQYVRRASRGLPDAGAGCTIAMTASLGAAIHRMSCEQAYWMCIGSALYSHVCGGTTSHPCMYLYYTATLLAVKRLCVLSDDGLLQEGIQASERGES
jgi:hypothetical protein